MGNSGSVLGTKWGSEIDRHDAVMRINYAPIDKWGADVGEGGGAFSSIPSRSVFDIYTDRGVHDVKWTLHKKGCHWLGFAPNEVVEKPARDNATTSIVYQLIPPQTMTLRVRYWS